MSRHQRKFARRRLAVVLCAYTLALAACRPTELTPRDVAVRIDEVSLLYSRFEDYLAANVGTGEPALSSAAMSELFDQFIDEELLTREAEARGLLGESASPRSSVEALLAQVLDQEVRPEDVAAYYDTRRSEFQRPARVRLRQVLTTDLAQAERALAALRDGESFAEVARRYSVDASAAMGGDQGELAEADLPPAFVEPVFRLQAGEYSPVVRAEYGYHVFYVEERQPPEVIPFDEARAEIEDRLRQDRADRELARLLAAARDRYNVLVFERNLPFEYQGRYRAPATSSAERP